LSWRVRGSAAVHVALSDAEDYIGSVYSGVSVGYYDFLDRNRYDGFMAAAKTVDTDAILPDYTSWSVRL